MVSFFCVLGGKFISLVLCFVGVKVFKFSKLEFIGFLIKSHKILHLKHGTGLRVLRCFLMICLKMDFDFVLLCSSFAGVLQHFSADIHVSEEGFGSKKHKIESCVNRP